MKKQGTLIVLALLTSIMSLADEPLWSKEERTKQSDVVIHAKVEKATKLHGLENDKFSEVWGAKAVISRVTKGQKDLAGKTILIIFERGTIIKGTKVRQKRCPRCADLKAGDSGTFYLDKVSPELKKQFKLEKIKGAMLFLHMASSFRKGRPEGAK